MHARKTMAFVVLAALVLTIVPWSASESDATTETVIIPAEKSVDFTATLSDGTYVVIDIDKTGRTGPQDVDVVFDMGKTLNTAQKTTAQRQGGNLYSFSIDFSTVPQNGAVTMTFPGYFSGFNVSLPHNVCMMDDLGNITVRNAGTYSGGQLTITGPSEGLYVMYTPIDEQPLVPETGSEPEDLTPAVAVAVAGAGTFAILVLVFVLLRKGEL